MGTEGKIPGGGEDIVPKKKPKKGLPTGKKKKAKKEVDSRRGLNPWERRPWAFRAGQIKKRKEKKN